jgi:hypothetical protein
MPTPRRSRRTWSGKTKFARGNFGFRNASDKGFLKSPKDWARAFIPETGWPHQKVKKRKSNRQNPNPEKSVRMEISLLHPVGA